MLDWFKALRVGDSIRVVIWNGPKTNYSVLVLSDVHTWFLISAVLRMREGLYEGEWVTRVIPYVKIDLAVTEGRARQFSILTVGSMYEGVKFYLDEADLCDPIPAEDIPEMIKTLLNALEGSDG